ncbi:hypothetical protein [Absidia glauca]|uniref:PNPLA domain-containing protein n=1 Tax=Absidia glauca TaxID=4829 RepID=A0A163J2R1_ABSGL|nr:hypothetical protein [Absidia glauca]
MAGLDEWKKDPKSDEYDWELVQNRLNQLRIVRDQANPSTMIFQLRTSLARNLGDMDKSQLYAHSRVGTKALISSYIEEVTKQLNWICDETSELDYQAKHDFFMNIRQSFGRTALLLSGGGTLGLYHLGVLKCLANARLLPRIISGASSGSIMASLICTKTVDEIPQMFDPSSVKLDVFERDGSPDTPFMRIKRLLTDGQLYDVEILTEAMRANLGDITFQEAFNRTRWILNITVSSSTVYDMPRLLNYLTSPDVLIWSAVAASCSVPIFYGSSPLYAKDKNGNVVLWNPSGRSAKVKTRLGTLLSMKTNSAIPFLSTVNPHVIPFLQKSNSASSLKQAASFCMHLANTEIQHRCNQLTELGILPSIFSKMKAIMSQKYSGDITIVPQVDYTDFVKVLSNPSQEFVAHAIVQGERATWSKMSIIKNHLQIELTIDNILYRLRLRHISQMISSPPPPRPHLETRSTSLLTLPTRTTKLSEETVEEEEISNNMSTARKVTSRTNGDQTHKGQEEDITKGKMSDKILRSTKRGLWMTSNAK